MKIFQKWIDVITKPAEAFKKEKGKVTIVDGLKHILIAGVIGGIFLGIATIFGRIPETMALLEVALEVNYGAVLAIVTIIMTPISLVITWLVVGVIYYVFARILGGKGTYTKQVYLMSLYIAPIFLIQTIVGLVPIKVTLTQTLGKILSMLVALYALYPLTMALKEVHKYDTKKAVLSWLIPYIVLAIIAILSGNMFELL